MDRSDTPLPQSIENGELHTCSARQVHTLIREKHFTVEQYATALLERIKARDEIIHAWSYLDPTLVLAQARQLDKIPTAKRGPLHGVAVGIKDVMLTKGE